MAADPGLSWWLLPGNHDSLAAGELWRRIAADRPANVMPLLAPEPVELAPGAVLLPAPCTHRRPGRDLTDWMAGAATAGGVLRIGLAHGGVQAFSEDGNPALIPPDRAETAGLAFLALGDWHRQLAIGPRTWYAGAPEADGFKHAAPCGVVVVTLAGPGAAPSAPGRDRRLRLAERRARAPPRRRSAFRLQRLLPPPADRRDTLLRLAASGRTGLAGEAALDRALAAVEHDFAFLETDRAGLAIDHAPADLDAFDATGSALRAAADALRAEADDPRFRGGAPGRAHRALAPLRLRRRSRMKLRSITLTDVRRFAGTTARLDGLGDGLSVVAAPNEAGKSTFFEALQALFTAAARSSAAEVRALRPYAGGAPQVAAEVEIDGRRYEIAKRWLSRPFARVTELATGRLVAQDDEAERWIRDRTAGDGPASSGCAKACSRSSPRAAPRGEGRAGAPARRPPRPALVGCARARGDHRRPPHGRHRRPMRGRPREARHIDRQAEDRRPLEAALDEAGDLRDELDRLDGLCGGLVEALAERGQVATDLWPAPPTRPRSTPVAEAVAAAERAALDAAPHAAEPPRPTAICAARRRA